jgi:hypothetical protein
MAEEVIKSAVSSLIGSVVGGGRFETLKATLAAAAAAAAAAAGEGTVLNGGYEGPDLVSSQ